MKNSILILSLIFSINAYSEIINRNEFNSFVVDNQLIAFKCQEDTGRKIAIPQPKGRVNDFEEVFSKAQIQELDSIIKKFEIETGNQIAVVSVSTIFPYEDFFDFSLDLFNSWGIGNADLDNGLLILFSKNLRQVRITTGKGTERYISDAECGKVIDKTMIPNFKKSLYYEAIKQGLIKLIGLWK